MKSKYLIGEVAKYLDISKDALRFYDKQGIVSPVKEATNGYRYYTNDEIIKLIYLIILKSLEVSLEEIKQLLNNCTLEELKKIIEEKQLKIEEKINSLNKIKNTLSNFKEDINTSIELTNKFEIINSPKLIFKVVSDDFDENLVKEIKKLEKSTDINSVYYTSIIYNSYYQGKSLADNINDGVSGLLIANNKNYVGYKIYNNKKCIHTVIKITSEIGEEDLVNIIKYIEENNFTVIGDTLCRYITFENIHGKSIDYVELYIPIQ